MLRATGWPAAAPSSTDGRTRVCPAACSASRLARDRGARSPSHDGWPPHVFISPSLAVSQVDNVGPRKFTHKRSCNSNIYLVRLPFIFGKKLQPQTILSGLRKTVISTFPVITAPFCRRGDSNDGGCNPHRVHLTGLIFKSHSMPCDSLARRYEKIT